ncbi:lamin tail domain-containing protein [Priestia abyssalis]|uniref:lamin tail domain-containing protein n=1 Tax=Priestia abyssalis TaxID=1221450 RepID=UPI000995843F|nr:lamin tail domain-containing protein [Priestia abyssalis]
MEIKKLMKMKKVLSVSFASVLLTGSLSSLVISSTVKAETNTADHIVISEVYGGGGNSGATLKNDFIELYNPADQAVSLDGWSVQYASSKGLFSTNKTELKGIIQPKSYYLVQQAAGDNAAAEPLPAPDTEGKIAMSSSSGKVALVRNEEAVTGKNDTDVVDFVGYGSANEFEGDTPTDSLSNTTSAQRKDSSIDTNNNKADFEVKEPTPINSFGQTSEQPGDGGDTDTPGDGEIPGPTLRIRDIQGASHTSPFAGREVTNIQGIVTAVEARGFYIQDDQPDQEVKTSEGIYIYKSNAGVQVGDKVSVDGEVKEHGYDGELTITELIDATVKKISSDNSLPSPIVLGEGEYILPTTIIDNDGFNEFDPKEDGIDFFESIEGMYVQVANAKVVGPTDKNGEIKVVPGNQPLDATYTTAGGILLEEDDANPERVIIDDIIVKDEPQVKVGDSFNNVIKGVIHYSYGNYKLFNTEALPEVIEGKAAQEATAIDFDKKQLTIASYNVENFSKSVGAEKTEKLAKAVVEKLKTPDIVGLVEMQDNNGAKNDGITDASESYMVLIEAIKAAGGPEYAFTDIAPENNQDGGQPGGNIRVGYIYNPKRVQLVDDKPKGDAVTPVEIGKRGLSHNPGRIDPANPVFENSRKPLAAEFKFKGQKITVIANHFNSKGGDDTLFGSNQPPVLESEKQRKEIAKVVNGFVEEIIRKDKEANVVLLGDLNDFQFSGPLEVLKGKSLTNMIEQLPASEQYTYNYQGNAQVLDHILVSNNLVGRTEADIVHINSDFTEEHGCASDHDPVLVQVDLKEKQDKHAFFKTVVNFIAGFIK